MLRASDSRQSSLTRAVEVQQDLDDLGLQFIGITSDSMSTTGEIKHFTFTDYPNSYYIASGSISAPSTNTGPATVTIFSNIFVAGFANLSIPAGQYLELTNCFIDRIQLQSAAPGIVNYIFSMSIIPKAQAEHVHPKVFLRQ